MIRQYSKVWIPLDYYDLALGTVVGAIFGSFFYPVDCVYPILNLLSKAMAITFQMLNFDGDISSYLWLSSLYVDSYNAIALFSQQCLDSDYPPNFGEESNYPYLEFSKWLFDLFLCAYIVTKNISVVYVPVTAGFAFSQFVGSLGRILRAL